MNLFERVMGVKPRQPFAELVMEGLREKTRRRLRKLLKKEQGSPAQMTGKDVTPVIPVGGVLSGPGSFGPVSIGGIMRHS